MGATRQPQYFAQIDRSNPLTKGLVSVLDGRSGRDLLANAFPTANTTTPSVGGSGIGALYASTTYETLAFTRSTITNQTSYFALFDHNPPGTPNSFIFGDVQASSTGYNAGLYSNSTVFSVFVKTGGSGTQASGTTSSNAAIAKVRLLGTYDGATIRVYCNGTQEGTAAKTGNVDAGAFSLNVNRWNNASPHGGKFYLGLVWNRALTAAEAKSLSDNPWQIFASPQRARKFFSVAAGGATGTSATTNAADTGAASGTTTVTGTLARTNANDASSAAGSTTILGTSATTNAADASAASGAVGGEITGTATTVNANDAAAGAGTTTVTGAAATTNAADTASASGVAGAVSGTAACVNAPDTCTARGIGSPDTQTSGGFYEVPNVRRRRSVQDERKRLGITTEEVNQLVVEVAKETVQAVKTDAEAQRVLAGRLAEENVRNQAAHEMLLRKERDRLLSRDVALAMAIRRKQEADDEDEREAEMLLM